jgi:hypothetical protein
MRVRIPFLIPFSSCPSGGIAYAADSKPAVLGHGGANPPWGTKFVAVVLGTAEPPKLSLQGSTPWAVARCEVG